MQKEFAKIENSIEKLAQSTKKGFADVNTSIEYLAQITANGFADVHKKLDVHHKKFDLIFKELGRLGDEVHDLKSITKSHQQMLMDHERRFDLSER